MQICYIILAHRYPDQLKRLVQKLTIQETFFYIHIDKNVLIAPFFSELSEFKNICFIESRQEGIWGDIGTVKATISALEQIMKDKRDGYCILLSGQDYPIKSNDFISSYLKSNLGNEFIDIFPLPTKYWSTDRMEKYKFNLSTRKQDFVLIGSIWEPNFFTKKTLKKIYCSIKAGQYICLLKILKKRRYPDYIRPFGGSQWWALTTKTSEKIVNFVIKNPSYINYHEYSLIPDEMFFQSIVMYLVEKKNDIKIMPHLTYANWEKKNCDLPVTFTLSDFEELISQPISKLFARKFDINIDSKVLDKIDDFCKN